MIDGKMRIAAIGYALLWVISLIIISSYNTLDMVSLSFWIIAGITAIYLFKNNPAFGNISDKRRYKLGECLVSIYLTSALFGRSIFMQSARLEATISKVVCFAILTISLYPITPGIQVLFQKLSERKRNDNNEGREALKTSLICVCVIFCIDLLIALSYYPCTMTSDSIGHWHQVTGFSPLSDYSPIAFNLLLKGLFSITGYTTPFIYVFFQTVVLSVIVGDITSFLFRKGVNRKTLIIGSCLLAVSPSTYMLLVYLSKNPLTGIVCLGMVVSLLQVISDPSYYLERPLWYIKTILIICAVYFTRENNVVIVLPLMGFVTWFLLSHKKQGKKY